MNSTLLLPAVAARFIDLLCHILTAVLIVYFIVFIVGLTVLVAEERIDSYEDDRLH